MRADDGPYRTAVNSMINDFPNVEGPNNAYSSYVDVQSIVDANRFIFAEAKAILTSSMTTNYKNEAVHIGSANVVYMQIGILSNVASLDKEQKTKVLDIWNGAQGSKSEPWNIDDKLNCGTFKKVHNTDKTPFCYFGVYGKPYNRTLSLERLEWFQTNYASVTAPGLVAVDLMVFTENPTSPYPAGSLHCKSTDCVINQNAIRSKAEFDF